MCIVIVDCDASLASSFLVLLATVQPARSHPGPTRVPRGEKPEIMRRLGCSWFESLMNCSYRKIGADSAAQRRIIPFRSIRAPKFAARRAEGTCACMRNDNTAGLCFPREITRRNSLTSLRFVARLPRDVQFYFSQTTRQGPLKKTIRESHGAHIRLGFATAKGEEG